jgi:hypothetical protein
VVVVVGLVVVVVIVVVGFRGLTIVVASKCKLLAEYVIKAYGEV